MSVADWHEIVTSEAFPILLILSVAGGFITVAQLLGEAVGHLTHRFFYGRRK